MPDPTDETPTTEADGGIVETPSLPPTPEPRHPRPTEDASDRGSQRSADEQDIGWGDGPSSYDDDWYLAERPPHHG